MSGVASGRAYRDLGYAKISCCCPFGVKMKIKYFEHINAYRYLLVFENDEQKEADLINLIGSHVCLEELNTARIDPEWGCLEFKGGQVDIDPKTLYHFAIVEDYKEVA